MRFSIILFGLTFVMLSDARSKVPGIGNSPAEGIKLYVEAMTYDEGAEELANPVFTRSPMLQSLNTGLRDSWGTKRRKAQTQRLQAFVEKRKREKEVAKKTDGRVRTGTTLTAWLHQSQKAHPQLLDRVPSHSSDKSSGQASNTFHFPGFEIPVRKDSIRRPSSGSKRQPSQASNPRSSKESREQLSPKPKQSKDSEWQLSPGSSLESLQGSYEQFAQQSRPSRGSMRQLSKESIRQISQGSKPLKGSGRQSNRQSFKEPSGEAARVTNGARNQVNKIWTCLRGMCASVDTASSFI